MIIFLGTERGFDSCVSPTKINLTLILLFFNILAASTNCLIPFSQRSLEARITLGISVFFSSVKGNSFKLTPEPFIRKSLFLSITFLSIISFKSYEFCTIR